MIRCILAFSLSSPSSPHSDVSSNYLYGTIDQNFAGMDPVTGLLNIDNNYFYGLPSLFASGQQYCPDEVDKNISLSLGALSSLQFDPISPKPYQ